MNRSIPYSKGVCLLLFIPAIVIALNSCRKDIVRFDPDFVGFWTLKYQAYGACNEIIEITSDGHFHSYSPTYLSDCKRVVKDISGPAKADKNSIQVGIHVFNLDLKPTRIDTLTFSYDPGVSSQAAKSVMQMEVEGEIYYKVIGH